MQNFLVPRGDIVAESRIFDFMCDALPRLQRLGVGYNEGSMI